MTTQRQHEAKRLRRAADQAEQDALDAFRRAYPIGAEIAWTYTSNAIQHGHVVRHAYGSRVEVSNPATGKVYWIHHFHVLRLIP